MLKKVAGRLVKIEGVEDAVMFSGFDGASGTQASNAGAAYLAFKGYGERAEKGRSEAAIMDDMRKAVADIDEAMVFIISRQSSRASARADFA